MGGTFIAFIMFSFINMAATQRPTFLSWVFKILGCIHAELVGRLLRGNWAHSLLPPIKCSVGSTQGTMSQLSTASLMVNPGVRRPPL